MAKDREKSWSQEVRISGSDIYIRQGNNYGDFGSPYETRSQGGRIRRTIGGITAAVSLVGSVTELVRDFNDFKWAYHAIAGDAGNTSKVADPCKLPPNLILHGQSPDVLETRDTQWIRTDTKRVVVHGQFGEVYVSRGVHVDELDVCGTTLHMGIEGSVDTVNMAGTDSWIALNPNSDSEVGTLYLHADAADARIYDPSQQIHNTKHIS